MSWESSYELITATRFDGFLSKLPWNNDRDGPSDILLLEFHLHRLVEAAELHGWDKAKSSLTYEKLRTSCQSAVASYNKQGEAPETLKIRIVLSRIGALTANVSPTPPFTWDPTVASLFNPTSDDNPSGADSILTIYIDSQPTPTSIFTSTKTTQRALYNDARARVGLPLGPSPAFAESDVLLYNSDHFITETSIFNVAFYRSSTWITPAATTGCLPGVFRRWLLEQGRICEADSHTLKKESIKNGERVLLFNGVQGCRLGKIVRESQNSMGHNLTRCNIGYFL